MKVYELYFTDSIESCVNEELLCAGESAKELLTIGKDILEERGFQKAPYWRYLITSEGLYIDFGSWSKFLFLKNATIDEVMST